MSLIEKAVQRLDQLKQAGTSAPAASAAQTTGRTDRFMAAGSVVTSGRDTLLNEEGRVSRMVEIDLARLAEKGMVTPENPRAPIAEEYRVIKRPLLHNVKAKGSAAGANSNLIMISSALPGEGKSFSAVNLAISIALELDHTVLLVDADVSKPSVLKTFGLAPEPGLMDLISGKSYTLPDVLLRTNIEKLSILPAGMPHQRATEFLASDSMNRLLEELASRYADRIIIFDSPPLLVTTESRVLATHMGQIVLVVESGRTTQRAVQQALATIDVCPIKLLMLNKVRGGGPEGYYGYNYSYGYGSETRSNAA